MNVMPGFLRERPISEGGDEIVDEHHIDDLDGWSKILLRKLHSMRILLVVMRQ